MRFAKLLLAGLIAAIALIAGLFAAAVVAAGAVTALVARHFVRRPTGATPRRRVPMRTPQRRMNSDGAIEVSATEVPSETPLP